MPLQAYELGLTHENGYLWLLFAWYPINWWTTEPANRTSYEPRTCSEDVLERMLEYSIVIDHYTYVENKTAITSSGMVHACACACACACMGVIVCG